MATRTACLDALETAAEILDSSPSKAAYEDLQRTPSASTIIRVFGSWNAAKRQLGMEVSPSTGSRTADRPDGVSIPEDTTWEDLSADQRWHYRNVEWNTERTLRRRARLRMWLNDYKRERGCSNCAESDPACLDFHHLDEHEKEMNVSKMVTNGYGKFRLEKEVAKCDVLCANCHRKEHFEPPGSGRIRGD